MTSRSEHVGLGLAGREDSWNVESDLEWFWVLSANEWVLAAGEEHPTLSASRALGLLIEQLGVDAIERAINHERDKSDVSA